MVITNKLIILYEERECTNVINKSLQSKYPYRCSEVYIKTVVLQWLCQIPFYKINSQSIQVYCQFLKIENIEMTYYPLYFHFSKKKNLVKSPCSNRNTCSYF